MGSLRKSESPTNTPVHGCLQSGLGSTHPWQMGVHSPNGRGYLGYPVLSGRNTSTSGLSTGTSQHARTVHYNGILGTYTHTRIRGSLSRLGSLGIRNAGNMHPALVRQHHRSGWTPKRILQQTCHTILDKAHPSAPTAASQQPHCPIHKIGGQRCSRSPLARQPGGRLPTKP